MFVIDTDHVSLLEWGSGAIGQRLHERIRALPEDEVATTIISFEAQMDVLEFDTEAATEFQRLKQSR